MNESISFVEFAGIRSECIRSATFVGQQSETTVEALIRPNFTGRRYVTEYISGRLAGVPKIASGARYGLPKRSPRPIQSRQKSMA